MYHRTLYYRCILPQREDISIVLCGTETPYGGTRMVSDTEVLSHWDSICLRRIIHIEMCMINHRVYPCYIEGGEISNRNWYAAGFKTPPVQIGSWNPQWFCLVFLAGFTQLFFDTENQHGIRIGGYVHKLKMSRRAETASNSTSETAAWTLISAKHPHRKCCVSVNSHSLFQFLTVEIALYPEQTRYFSQLRVCYNCNQHVPYLLYNVSAC